MKKIFVALFVSVILSAGGIGAPGNQKSERYDAEGFRHTLASSKPQIAKSNGYTQFKIEKFGETGEEGKPRLPVKIFKAAIPENAEILLSIINSKVEEFQNVRIAPVPQLSFAHHPKDITEENISERSLRNDELPPFPREEKPLETFRERPDIYDSPGPYPLSPVKLGSTGYLRNQKYIEIIYYPVIYYPLERKAFFFSEVTIDINFSFLGNTATDTSLTYTIEPAFEPIYRKSFINYEQGKAFRLEGSSKINQLSSSKPGDLLSEKASSIGAQQISGGTGQAPLASSTYKIKISKDGIYRLPYSYIQSNASDLLTKDPRTFKLMNRGTEVPIYVEGESDGVFNTTDYIEFYGQALTDEPKTKLNYDFPDVIPDIYQDNDFTDTNVYFLSAEDPPSSRERIPTVNGYPSSGYTPPSDFFDSAHVEHIEADGTNVDVYLPLAENDPWFWGPRILATTSSSYLDADITLPGLSTLTHTATMKVRLRGTSTFTADPDHQTATGVISGGTYIPNTEDIQLWDGENIFTHEKSFAQSYLSAMTKVRVEVFPLATVSLDEVIRDFIEIGYFRYFRAENDLLPFKYDNGANQFDVNNFTNPGIAIYEITDRVAGSNVVSAIKIINPRITGSGTYTASFEVANDPDLPAGEKRGFVLSSGSSILTPESCVIDTVSDLKSTSNQADIIVIGTPDTVDDSPGSPLDNLLASRYTNRGLTSKVVMFEDICDEFNNGLFDPNAIRTFLLYAYNNWSGRTPQYVFIVGDATYDYKNQYGLVDFKNYVPTQIMFQYNPSLGYHASDNWLACFLGDDQLPDIHLGRISTRSIAESNGVFDKIRMYEDSPPSGTWKSHDVMVSDEGKYGDPIETDIFESVNQRQIDTYLGAPPHSYSKIYYAKAPYNGTNNTLCRDDIKAAINSGALIVNYVGHGTFNRWSNDTILHTDDVQTLTNANLYPFLTGSNCLTGGFQHATITAIGERFVNLAGKGSIATFAPASLSGSFIGEVVINSIFDDIYGPHKERETAIITYDARDKLYTNGSMVDLQAYAYLGDPALDLVIPKPKPPTDPDAIGGNQRVDLSWARSADDPGSFGYNVYRTTNLANPYTKLNTTAPVYGTTYTDTNVTNMTTYYYAFTAIDAEGFESAYSNFNSDCASDGADCVKATPANPNPPANPAGFDAVDPETGGKLNLSWNANTESDLKGYTLYWGTVSRFDPGFPGSYQNSRYLGKVTSYTLTGLQDGVTYYLCVTATNTSLKESGYSNEDSEKPDLVQGIRPPKAISDLMVKRSPTYPDSLELTWSKPTVDIFGDPETIKEYRIYRSALPNYVPSDANRIAIILDPNTTSYTDGGAYSSPSNYYYLVQSIDVDGNASGVGSELPAGINDLAVGKSKVNIGNIILTWSAVTKDIFGKPSMIDHYHLYAQSTKFRRSDIEKGLVPLLQDNVKTTILEFAPAAENQYYSVIAVDNRGNKSPN